MAEEGLISLNSSNLAWCEYDGDSKTLTIGFHQENAVYEYYDVPEWVVDEMIDSPSQGSYFRANLYWGYKRNLLGQWRHTDKGVHYDRVG